METTKQLSDQMIRDLAWIFKTPPLVQSNLLEFQQKPLHKSWLEAKASPSKEKTALELYQFMADKNLRMLGPYFEALWEFYLTHYPRKKLVAKNLQVFGEDKTIGEFDFIYLDEETNEYSHLEVAIKYFLGLTAQDNSNALDKQVENLRADLVEIDNVNGSFSSMSQWLGPNANDRLDIKYLKMLEHQSQLSKTPEGKTAIKSLGISESDGPIKSEVCLLGFLFYPLENEVHSVPLSPPENSHCMHNKGYWLRSSQLEDLLPEGVLWKILEKPFWLAPLQQEVQQLSSLNDIFTTLREHFAESERPLLISNFIAIQNVEETIFESEQKYFVVSDSWPENDKTERL